MKHLILILALVGLTACQSEYTDPRLTPYVASVNSLLEDTCGLSVPSDISFKLNSIEGFTAGFHRPELDYSAVIVVDTEFFYAYENSFAIDYLLLHELAHDFKVQHIEGHPLLDVTTDYNRLALIDPYLNPMVLEVCELLKLKSKFRGLAVPAIGL